MSLLESAVGRVLDWAFPRICMGCGAPVVSIAGGILCETCRPSLAPIEGPVCFRCAHPAGKHIDTTNGCPLCKGHAFSFDSAHSAGLHEGVLREIILAFKYHRRRDLLLELSGFMQGALLKRLPRSDIDVVVPVPLHRSRRRGRGFNQAELLARPLAAALGVPVDTRGLVRTRKTKAQIGLSFSARQDNVKDAFRANEKTFKGKSVLLVDDILTTGATGSECAHVLKRAGARAVHFAVLARPGQ